MNFFNFGQKAEDDDHEEDIINLSSPSGTSVCLEPSQTVKKTK